MVVLFVLIAVTPSVDRRATYVHVMKMNVSELRSVIREEYLRGVPEFVVRQATDRFIDDIKAEVIKYVLAHRSRSVIERERVLDEMSEHLDDLKADVNDLLDEKLYAFVQSI